jgi:steroid delta-isomerase-like uncharacterized protein
MASSKENCAIVRRVFGEVINQRRLAAIDEIYAPAIVDHDPVPGAPPGIDGVKYSLGGLLEAFPDLHVEIEDMSAHLDKVVVHNTWRGTRTGALLGLPPTGKAVSYTGIVVWRLESGKITERWAMTEVLDALGVPQAQRGRQRGFIHEDA